MDGRARWQSPREIKMKKKKWNRRKKLIKEIAKRNICVFLCGNSSYTQLHRDGDYTHANVFTWKWIDKYTAVCVTFCAVKHETRRNTRKKKKTHTHTIYISSSLAHRILWVWFQGLAAQIIMKKNIHCRLFYTTQPGFYIFATILCSLESNRDMAPEMSLNCFIFSFGFWSSIKSERKYNYIGAFFPHCNLLSEAKW